jgi:tetratricopeptide (TPR) repeat protein
VDRGSYRQALIVAITIASGSASAAPSGAEARAQFDRGVAAYTKGDYQTADEAFGASAAMEQDPETLFAWAQTERKLDRCDRAIDLYAKLLAMDLPAENKTAINVSLGECKQILAAKPIKPVEPIHEDHPTPPPIVAPPSPEAHPWWQDPIGDTLVGAGIVGLGVGAVMLVSAHSADQAKDHATTYSDFVSDSDRANHRGEIGVIAAAAGGAFAAAGIIRYVTRHESSERAVSAWLAPSSGGFAVAGRF